MGVENRRKSSVKETDVYKVNRIRKFYWMLVGFLLAVIVVLLVLLIGNLNNMQNSTEPGQTPSTQPSETGENHWTIYSISEQGSQVVVTTNFCQLKYPYAFSDLIKVEAITEGNTMSLQFSAIIDGESHKLYVLTLGGQGDLFVCSLTVTPGQAPIRVHGTLYQPGPELSEDGRFAFVAAQETFHDVVVSLQENMSFMPAA